MSDDDIERFEEERELELYREYRDVLPMFTYVIETERRFYLANKVDAAASRGGWVRVDLADAWVWDMFRPARFVASVRVMTRRDVNVEELARRDEPTTIPETPPPPRSHPPGSVPAVLRLSTVSLPRRIVAGMTERLTTGAVGRSTPPPTTTVAGATGWSCAIGGAASARSISCSRAATRWCSARSRRAGGAARRRVRGRHARKRQKLRALAQTFLLVHGSARARSGSTSPASWWVPVVGVNAGGGLPGRLLSRRRSAVTMRSTSSRRSGSSRCRRAGTCGPAAS